MTSEMLSADLQGAGMPKFAAHVESARAAGQAGQSSLGQLCAQQKIYGWCGQEDCIRSTLCMGIRGQGSERCMHCQLVVSKELQDRSARVSERMEAYVGAVPAQIVQRMSGLRISDMAAPELRVKVAVRAEESIVHQRQLAASRSTEVSLRSKVAATRKLLDEALRKDDQPKLLRNLRELT